MSPVLAIASAGLATLLAWPLSRWLGRGAGWPLAALYLLGAALLLPEIHNAGVGFSRVISIPWVPARGWTLDLFADPTGLLFAMLALVIGAIVLIYSSSYLEGGEGGPSAGLRPQHYGFFQLMTVFTVSMLGLVLTDSMLLLYVCWELTSLASFALIANSGRPAYAAALRTLTVTIVGGLVLLGALVAIWLRTDTTSISAALTHDVWATDPGFTAAVAVAVAIAAFTKSAQFPFHFWLPDAMAASTPVSAYLHAAAVVKAGIFLLMRFSPAFHDVPVWNAVLVSVGMGTAVMAAVFALQKTDLKQLMAYSTVSQLGWIITAIGVGTQAALAAAALHTVAHALFKSGLFMLVGVVDHGAGTRDIRELGPLWRRMPWAFGATVLGAAAMAAVPPTLGFVSKESMLTAFGDVVGGPVAVTALLAAAVIGAILTFLYCARIVLGGFLGAYRDPARPAVGAGDVHEGPLRLWLPAALPAAIGLPLALVVGVFDAPMSAVAKAAAGPFGWEPVQSGFAQYRALPPGSTESDLSYEADFALWHGVTLELGLTALILIVGVLLVWRRGLIDRALDRELLPFTGASALEGLMSATTRAGRALIRPTESDSPARHAGALLAALIVYTVGIGGWALASGAAIPPRVAGLDSAIDIILLIVVAVAVVGLCIAHSRLSAAVLLSAVGIAVTIQIFGLGAPDVGLTQLLVEALTIIMFVLVLRRLPRDFIPASRRRNIAAIVLAALTGVVATVSVLVFTGRRERSPIGMYLLENGPEITGGNNVVNTILVEFRALDTLGEVAVLGVAGIAILAVLGSVRTPADAGESAPDQESLPGTEQSTGTAAEALEDAARNTVPLQLLARGVTPVLALISLILLWRGHNEPGGGFIAALVASCAFALIYLARESDRPVSRPSTPVALIGAGLLLTGLTGVGGYAIGQFLEPAHWLVAGQHISSALIFDLGVFAAVLGLVMTAFNTLGAGRAPAEVVPGPDAPDTAHRTGGGRRAGRDAGGQVVR
ncbi:hydrogen gas-evolving membrane-bound hydrogenase subunit E [Dietzia alimentaria]|uniref:hydrogen gas-evolving membrane-bound hydrogenase subunit E n=1 Tax=Dietzia alimentaria TaxID=665550 RepID=UPI000299E37B|nr:hydrogen gas-evolving membrane-bound hydrogenase subunit E [Dietzia alimentaria]